MKRIVFFILGLGMIMSLSNNASGWEQPGVFQQIGPRSYWCVPGDSWCSRSVKPGDPEPGVGDLIQLNLPNVGIVTELIISIKKTGSLIVYTVQDNNGTTMTITTPAQ